MRLDILNEILSPDLTKADWNILFIDKYVARKHDDGYKYILSSRYNGFEEIGHG